jgi:hypothetical protein
METDQYNKTRLPKEKTPVRRMIMQRKLPNEHDPEFPRPPGQRRADWREIRKVDSDGRVVNMNLEK